MRKEKLLKQLVTFKKKWINLKYGEKKRNVFPVSLLKKTQQNTHHIKCQSKYRLPKSAQKVYSRNILYTITEVTI